MSPSQAAAPATPRRAGAVLLLLLGFVLVLCGLSVVGLMAAATTLPDFSWDAEYIPILYTSSAVFLFVALIGGLLIRGASRRLRGGRAA